MSGHCQNLSGHCLFAFILSLNQSMVTDKNIVYLQVFVLITEKALTEIIVKHLYIP